MRVVEASRDEDKLLRRLMELYAYDFSELLPLELDSVGYFFAQGWSWDEVRDRVFLLYSGGHPAGFAIASRGSVIDERTDVWDMHEFFVMKRYRRQGGGSRLAREVWRLLPGTWDIRVIPPNIAALAFWRRAAESAGGDAEWSLAVNSRSGKHEHHLRFVPRLAGHAGFAH